MMQARVWSVVTIAATSLVALVHAAHGAQTKCELTYDASGWSAFYKTAAGTGKITCDNGQSAPVKIRVKAGGVTFGRFKVTDGHGTFSAVDSINDLYGKWATAGAEAGMVKSAQAKVVTKGTVSLALTGTGQGVDIGVDVGEFVIEPQDAPKKKK